MTVAFFGTGLMGSGFARHLCAIGVDVNLWNRSPAKAQVLQAYGAKAFANPADALAGAERIHLSLGDDASVDAVLEPLADQIGEAVWIVDHSTTAVAPTAERAARWAARGKRFVHAPVFMGPANATEGTGLMLMSGPVAAHDALQHALQAMTGKLVYLGEAPERAAAFKLFGNLALLGVLGVLGDVARLAKAVGISSAEAFSLFEQFNPGQTLPVRAAKIASGNFSHPSFEVAMARKDVRLMLEEAQRGGVDLMLMPGVAAMLDAAMARGEGALDCSAAARAPD